MPGLSGLWSPDFLQLAGVERAIESFECSTTFDGVTGTLSVDADGLVLGGTAPTVRLTARDISSWWDSSSDGTFSLAIEAGTRHTIVLLSQFQTATVHAMTRVFGPRALPSGSPA